MLIEGDIEINARDLEDTINAAVAAERRGGLLLPLTGVYDPAKTGLRFVDSGAVAVDPDRENDGTLEIGLASMGSVIIMKLDPDRTSIGPSVAPKAIQAIDLARELWGVDIPPLVPAPDLCT